jgi:hypothetical protein
LKHGRKKMKQTIILALLVSVIATAQPDTESNLTVEEVFSVETTQELEAALTDGYPMPWLAEILEDETIPEEDRYWLDCRVRAAIAMDLHLFYDREGNSVAYDAEWIMPGENYWRETFVLSPFGNEIISHPVEFGGNLRGEISQLINHFGNKIGETALTARGFRSSRDGSIWASSLCRVDGHYRLVLLYSTGNYFVSPIEMGYGRCAVSQSGEYVLLAARGRKDTWGAEYLPHRIILMNKNGNILWENELEMTPIGNPGPVISPDDRYCSVVTQASSAEDRLTLLLQVFDIQTGVEVWRLEDPMGTTVTFSPDGQFLCLSGKEAFVINASTGNIIWSDHLINRSLFPVADLMHLMCSEDASVFVGMAWPSERLGPESVMLTLFDKSGKIISTDNIYGDIAVSPNGYFAITENYSPGSDRTVCPLIIRKIMQGGV